MKHFLPLCVELCRPDAISGHKTAASSGSGKTSPASGQAVSLGGDATVTSTSTSSGGDGDGGAPDGSVASASLEAALAGSPKNGEMPAAGTVVVVAGAETRDQLSFFPDPTRGLTEHSPVARGVAYIFLKRQQVRRVLSRFFCRAYRSPRVVLLCNFTRIL